ncbi:MAG TPA: maleylpyruvate isomerase family mycothiol-dependent enzyme [Actinomycetota bacterium]|nr:maleylpyruvate isomerase family mycothiol-dependent enzyme [Actinomycetota bacterium]
MNPLVTAWEQAMESFQRTVAQVPDADFARDSLLPGWTVADIVAHVAALEAELSGQPLPAHEPDWDALPHANDLFSRYTEIGVDYRRGWTPVQLRTELAQVAVTRTEQLTTGPQDSERRVVAVGGIERSFGRLLRMRCFDIFLHDLDIRDALHMPPPELAEAARVTAGLMADALGFVWVKRAGAQPGDVLHFVVPDWIDAWVGVGEDGRGGVVEPGQAAVTVTLAPLEFLRLASGRGGDPDSAGIEGDAELGRRVVSGLNVSP